MPWARRSGAGWTGLDCAEGRGEPSSLSVRPARRTVNAGRGESRPLRRSGVGFVVIGAGLLGLSTTWHLLRRARDLLALERGLRSVMPAVDPGDMAGSSARATTTRGMSRWPSGPCRSGGNWRPTPAPP